MKTVIYSIPGHVTGTYDSNINGIIDTWESLLISMEDFKSTVYDIGIAFAKENNVTAWIVDTSQGQEVFSKEVQDFVELTLSSTCAKIGIKFFFVVLPQSSLGKQSAKQIAKINGEQLSMQTIEVHSVQEALDLLEEVHKV